MCSGMGRAVLGQESGYLTLPHASQGASARISTFRAPVPSAAQREGSQLACGDSESKTRMRRSSTHELTRPSAKCGFTAHPHFTMGDTQGPDAQGLGTGETEGV